MNEMLHDYHVKIESDLFATKYVIDTFDGEICIKATNSDDMDKVSNHLNYGWPMGSTQFLIQLGHQTSRPVLARKAGRPKKQLPK